MSIFGKFDRKNLRKSIAKRQSRLLKENEDIANVFKMVPTKYHIIINDVPVGFLSPSLAEKQKISDSRLENLKKLHISKDELFEMMDLSDPENPPSELFFPECAKLLKDIEFLMQKEWRFSEDEACHTWWCKAPHCTCPKLDNAERFGTKCKIIREDCPLHGNKVK